MKKITRFRSRLAALTSDPVEALRSSPTEALAACRRLQDELRELKREVLDQLLALRGQAADQARRALGTRPSRDGAGRDGAGRQDVQATSLLGEIEQQVKGLLDDKSGAAVAAWAEINGDIGRRLERLAELEQELTRAAGESAPMPPPPPVRERGAGEKAGDDELYAAVGAAVQQGAERGAPFCPHCGRGIEPEDRFCRRCGHHLR